MSEPGDEPPIDLRVTASALATWATTAVVVGLSPGRAVLVGVALLAVGLLLRRHRRTAVALLVAAAAAMVAGLHVTAVFDGPLPALALERAVVTAEVVVTTDPVIRPTRYGEVVVTEVRVETVVARGAQTRIRSPVLVFGDEQWRSVQLGTRLRVVGRLEPAADQDLAAVLSSPRIDAVLGEPAWWWKASSQVRSAVRTSVAHTSADAAALVPALVDGDDTSLSEQTAEEFRATGLTHLLAVSGTNLTLVVGFLLAVGRAVGVRGYGQVVVGVLGTVGFVLLARPDPSVLRAAAMGLVALSGLGAGGRRRGMRVLSVAVLGLLLVSPWLARSVGFALSVLATAGILLLAPAWRDAMTRWMPRWLAEAVAVPMAAQLMCTPLIAAISGQVSLVAVGANLLAAPAVGPATVLGLLAGLVTLLWEMPGRWFGTAAAAAASWIVTVADRGAALGTPALDWGSTGAAIAVLAVLCLAAVVLAPRILRSRRLTLGVTALALPVVLGAQLPGWVTGWPPDGWVLVACDVGQGDGLVLNAGDGRAVVVDTGPDPELMDRCLDRLGIDKIPLVVLTHPHADHVEGLPGVLDGRAVGEIEVSTPSGAPDLGVPVRTAALGEAGSVGQLSWRLLGPVEGESVNDTSIVMLVQVRGVEMLLTGDVEPPAQGALLAWGHLLDVDVLKVPHHGSRYQDPAFLAATSPEVAVVSVGEDNDYGHPATSTVAGLRELGADVLRTDESGDIAVVVEDGEVDVRTR